MGLFESKPLPPPEIGEDRVVIPPWAEQLPKDSPKVFFDVAVEGNVIGRIEIVLAKVKKSFESHLLFVQQKLFCCMNGIVV